MLPYTNTEDITIIDPTVGLLIPVQDDTIIPNVIVNGVSDASESVDIHLYDVTGTYISSVIDVPYLVVSLTIQAAPGISRSAVIDINNILRNTLGIRRGDYVIVVNIIEKLVGSDNEPAFYIKEISPSRTEIRLNPVDSTNSTYVTQYARFISNYFYYKNVVIDNVSNIYENYSTPDYNFVGGLALFNSIILAVDTYITTRIINNQLVTGYNGLTNSYWNTSSGQYVFNASTNTALAVYNSILLPTYELVVTWCKAANVKLTAGIIQTFAAELNAFIAAEFENRIASRIENSNLSRYFQLRSNFNTVYGSAYYNASTIVRLGHGAVNPYYPEIQLNLGFNNVETIVNVVVDSDNSLLIKLVEPLESTITTKTLCYISRFVVDPIIDKVHVSSVFIPEFANNLRGPNFDIEVSYNTSTSTNYASYNSLIGTENGTNQKIVDRFFSSSAGVRLNVDYCEFENFVHFSNARRRVETFYYKLQLIEQYTSNISQLLDISGSTDLNIRRELNRRNEVVSNFDSFERYMFFQGTGSLCTACSCSITPWPKSGSSEIVQIIGDKWEDIDTFWDQYNVLWENGGTTQVDPIDYYSTLVPSTSVTGINFYNNLLELADAYDRKNINQLRLTVPFHIAVDSQNTEYIRFVDMIGHFYDQIWLYVKHITYLQDRNEKLDVGVSKDLIFGVAESLGLPVFNGYLNSDLTDYIDDEAYDPTGSIYPLSGETITKEIWKRLLNNIPYIYKTKGTARSVRAVMNCYGIPSTALSIDEFGGPDLEEYYNRSVYRYEYLNDGTDQNDYLLAGWLKNDRYNSSGYMYNSYPDTISIRYRTVADYSYTPGTEYVIYSIASGSNLTGYNSSSKSFGFNDTNPLVALTMKVIDSDTGEFKLYISGSQGYKTGSVTNLNLLDHEYSTIFVQRDSDNNVTGSNQSFSLYVYRAKDDMILESGSSTIAITTSASASYGTSWAPTGTPGANLGWVRYAYSSSFGKSAPGAYNEIRQWFGSLNESTKRIHTIAPETYKGNESQGAYYDLVYRYTLSRTTNVIDLDAPAIPATVVVSPSNQISERESAGLIYSGFDSKDDVIAQHYNGTEINLRYPYASLTGHNLSANKIRIESQSRSGNLSVDRSVVLGSYDTYTLDSNKLGIYFSPVIYLNQDILNRLGAIRIDDYIGNPSDEYSTEYDSLLDLQNIYFKNGSYNLNDYLSVYTLFNQSIFDQIQTLVPARANLISGILIQPHILERNKAVTLKLPVISNLTNYINLSGSYAAVSGIIQFASAPADQPWQPVSNTNDVQIAVPIDNNSSVATSYSSVIDTGTTSTARDTTVYGTVSTTGNQSALSNIVITNNDNIGELAWNGSGTQISSVSINSTSADTYDFGPVVEIL